MTVGEQAIQAHRDVDFRNFGDFHPAFEGILPFWKAAIATFRQQDARRPSIVDLDTWQQTYILIIWLELMIDSDIIFDFSDNNTNKTTIIITTSNDYSLASSLYV